MGCSDRSYHLSQVTDAIGRTPQPASHPAQPSARPPFHRLKWEDQECICGCELSPPAPREKLFSKIDSHPVSLGASLILFSSLGALNQQPHSERTSSEMFSIGLPFFKGLTSTETFPQTKSKVNTKKGPFGPLVHKSRWASTVWACTKQALCGAGRSLNIS